MESMWMLAGRQDLEFVQSYSSGMKNYSDDGETLNGAYGYRWRKWFGRDQLSEIIENLKKNPDCRRQVLAMWDGAKDLDGTSKDHPCNTTAYFQKNAIGSLDLCVCNRSNDLIWGAYGANAVHFSFLLEYVAAAIGMPVGSYFQFSFNTHVYERHWPMMDSLAEKRPEDRYIRCPYVAGEVVAFPILSDGEDVELLDRDLELLLEGKTGDIKTKFIRQVCIPIREAYKVFKNKDDKRRHANAIIMLGHMPPMNDWRIAAENWLKRRMPNVVKKPAGKSTP
jgi:hypothetical protein